MNIIATLFCVNFVGSSGTADSVSSSADVRKKNQSDSKGGTTKQVSWMCVGVCVWFSLFVCLFI